MRSRASKKTKNSKDERSVDGMFTRPLGLLYFYGVKAMSEMVMIIFILVLATILFVFLLISFGINRDFTTFAVAILYGAISSFFIYGLLAELFGWRFIL